MRHLVISAAVFLALWLLSGKAQMWSGLVAAGLLFSIALFNLSAWDIVFRDVSLRIATLALVFGRTGRAA